MCSLRQHFPSLVLRKMTLVALGYAPSLETRHQIAGCHWLLSRLRIPQFLEPMGQRSRIPAGMRYRKSFFKGLLFLFGYLGLCCAAGVLVAEGTLHPGRRPLLAADQTLAQTLANRYNSDLALRRLKLTTK